MGFDSNEIEKNYENIAMDSDDELISGDTDDDYSPDEEPSDEETMAVTRKKSIPDDILFQMTKTGVSFNILSDVLKLGFSIFGESQNYSLSPSHLFKRYQKIMLSKESTYQNEINFLMHANVLISKRRNCGPNMRQ